MELQTNQGQTHRPVLAEEELQRQEGVLLVIEGGAVVVEVTLGEVLGAGDWLNVGHVLNVLGVHHLTADVQLNLVNDTSPVWIHKDTAGGIADGQVHVAQQVTLLLKTNGGNAASNWCALNHLALHRICVVGITLVV